MLYHNFEREEEDADETCRYWRKCRTGKGQKAYFEYKDARLIGRTDAAPPSIVLSSGVISYLRKRERRALSWSESE
ncbi:Uncharacterised protein [Mycobacteroides abscessus subsp. bolletii]|uniref:Uncharacterized protein n=1 Tax=Mycobacteroides abscessus subsp. bolletii TaxID=319705 RepID=A0A9Q7WGZ3_9MYCO|nr:Uncharacterised protein [Mycobacteroides abscessus subsp. bolletii]SIC64750.1 Uncharacterised protein [Mycobacteroides abscessus subsp. abscessus]SHU04102.1 Uncharacterised protein [Mycobacteroides abscessus subsp. bolletii]SHW82643.1 Uncharacterised protein [Mycobacteroides abscessus subsp. bolletii]SKL86211.1 Uncharacterised protein [Mycobacteroides abscessus subsp. bolletii]